MNKRMVSRLVSLVGVLVVAAAVSIVLQRVISGGSDEGQAQFEQATNDEEWIALIEQAKQRKLAAGSDSAWPEPDFQLGVAVIRSCSDIPPDHVETQASIETSPDGTRRRFVFDYFGAATNSRLALILYSDSDVSGCSKHISDIVQGPDLTNDAVQKHLCDEMTQMAQGLPRTDETLRPASPRVAEAYLNAFCR